MRKRDKKGSCADKLGSARNNGPAKPASSGYGDGSSASSSKRPLSRRLATTPADVQLETQRAADTEFSTPWRHPDLRSSVRRAAPVSGKGLWQRLLCFQPWPRSAEFSAWCPPRLRAELQRPFIVFTLVDTCPPEGLSLWQAFVRLDKGGFLHFL